MSRGVPSSGDSPPSGPPSRALFITSAVFLSIFFVAFVLLLALALRCCRRRAGGDRAFPVETLPPAFAYACQQPDGHVARVARECAVCLGAVKDGEMVRRLPVCMHVYHVECIDRWLAAHRTCPLCRSELGPSSKVNTDELPPLHEDDDPPGHHLPAV